MHGFAQFLNMDISFRKSIQSNYSKILEDLQVEAARIIIRLIHNTHDLVYMMNWDGIY